MKNLISRLSLTVALVLSLAGVSVSAAPALADDAPGSFVPADCTVETWCLVKATDCFFGMFTQPQGLWQGHAQYSVVRKVVALCPTGYYGGQLERRKIMGPVEPIRFASDVETTRESASAQVMELCQKYRTDWVTAAPTCR